jgi:hypothetical protein
LPWDEDLFNKLKEDNDRELAEFQKEEDEAEEQAGDTINSCSSVSTTSHRDDPYVI